MIPTVAIVGRPNVGKSTLFNRLTRSRQAIVDNLPGVTRDRLFGEVTHEGRRFTVVDTGGFNPAADEDFSSAVHGQIEIAMTEADVVVMLFDAKEGLNPGDAEVVDRLRRFGGPVIYAANKIDGPEQEHMVHEFWALGVKEILPLSSAHGLGVKALIEAIAEVLPEPTGDELDEPAGIRVAILGRPNVGKSSLVNKLLGEERVVVSPQAGTTRDTVDTEFDFEGRRYTLMDTAGLRRKSRIKGRLERYSTIRAVNAIERCHVGLLMVDATEEVADQDMRIGRLIATRGRGCVIAVNKWDLVEGDEADRAELLDEVRYRLRFLDYAPMTTTSALTGKRLTRLLPLAASVYDQFNIRVNTGTLNRILERAVNDHPAGFHRGRPIKFTYVNQSVTRPPTFIVFTNAAGSVRDSYVRYLERRFREELGLDLTPIRFIFKARSKRRRS